MKTQRFIFAPGQFLASCILGAGPVNPSAFFTRPAKAVVLAEPIISKPAPRNYKRGKIEVARLNPEILPVIPTPAFAIPVFSPQMSRKRGAVDYYRLNGNGLRTDWSNDERGTDGNHNGEKKPHTYARTGFAEARTMKAMHASV
jgi:hypothetical protein